MKVYSNRYTMAKWYTILPKYLFWRQIGQFGPNLGKNYATLFCNVDLDLRIFFEMF